MTKALFFDIDGTLVSFETHRIPSSTIEALEAARAKGLKIFIATGRPKAIINNLSELQDRNLIDGYITMNGAYCFVGEQVIYKSAIPQDEVKAMGDFCEKKGVPCIFVEEHNISVCQPNDMVKKIFYDFLHVNVIPTVSFEEATSKEVIQMTPFITEEEEKEIRPSIPTCEIGRWYPAFADVTAKGDTKQKGIDEIIRYFDIKLEDTMAFGDGGNDISMLQPCSHRSSHGTSQRGCESRCRLCDSSHRRGWHQQGNEAFWYYLIMSVDTNNAAFQDEGSLKKLCIVLPPALIAAMPVGASTTCFFLVFSHRRDFNGKGGYH